MPNTNPSDGQAPAGDGTANPNTSTPPADSPPSIDAAEIFNALQAYPGFQEFVKSNAQSKHDKRINQIEKTLGLADQVAAVDKLTAEGLPRDFAIQWLEMQNKQAQTPAVEQPAPVVPVVDAVGQTVVTGQDNPVIQQAVDLGLDPNGPEVIQVLREGGNPVEQIRKLTSTWKAAQTAQVAPNPAATMTTSVGSPANVNLENQYIAERDALGLGKPVEFQALKDKYRKAGLNIL